MDTIERRLAVRGSRTPAAWRAAALDLLPIALLAMAAAVHESRIPLLAACLAGFAVTRRVDPRRSPAWAGAIPVAVSLAWGLAPLPVSARDGSTCASALAPFATTRVIDAALALAALGLLLPLVGGGVGELGLRRPSRRLAALSLAAFAASGPLGLLLGPALSEPFFGRVDFTVGDLRAVVPALLFAVSNGVMEEVVYRGALRAWTCRITGPLPAIVGQALVFGLAHTGADFVGSPLPVVASLAAGGLIAGLVAWRTGSLLLPTAVHIGVDIPLYYGNACRLIAGS